MSGRWGGDDVLLGAFVGASTQPLNFPAARKPEAGALLPANSVGLGHSLTAVTRPGCRSLAAECRAQQPHQQCEGSPKAPGVS